MLHECLIFGTRVILCATTYISVRALHSDVVFILYFNIVAVINLGGYTKGARNDIFAARPCPVQMQCMGYAGTLSAGGFQGKDALLLASYQL